MRNVEDRKRRGVDGTVCMKKVTGSQGCDDGLSLRLSHIRVMAVHVTVVTDLDVLSFESHSSSETD